MQICLSFTEKNNLSVLRMKTEKMKSRSILREEILAGRKFGGFDVFSKNRQIKFPPPKLIFFAHRQIKFSPKLNFQIGSMKMILNAMHSILLLTTNDM